MIVLEVHIIFLLDQLDDLIELVHVQLPDEGGQVAVAEEMRQHLVLHLLRVLDEDLGVAVPSQVLAVLFLLTNEEAT